MGRSFSVGGDFNDVSVLEHEHEVRPWLGEIIDLYIAILSVNIPVVAAMDRFAIGQGLQVALMSDWRIGTTRVPPLDARAQERRRLSARLGDPRGSLGRAKMLELLLDCEFIDADAGRALSPPQRDHSPDELEAAALRGREEACDCIRGRHTSRRSAFITAASSRHWKRCASRARRPMPPRSNSTRESRISTGSSSAPDARGAHAVNRSRSDDRRRAAR